MHKASRVHFNRCMSEFVEQAGIVHRLAVGILATEYAIPESHFQRQAEIASELVLSSPSIVQDVSLLTELGEHTAAVDAVRGALVALKNIDGFIFDPPPSERLLAALEVGVAADVSSWQGAVSSANYADLDTRRRRALKVKRSLHAAGLPIPTEADVAGHAGRDEAIADAMLGGVRSSRVSNG